MFWRKEVKPPDIAPEYVEPDDSPYYVNANPTYAPKPVVPQDATVRTLRPLAHEAPEGFYARRNYSTIANYNAEYLQGDEGLPLQVESQPVAVNPRSNPVQNDRYTANLSPSTYRFWRPFDQHAARQLNGNHFSMADNKREYEIFGMSPVISRRNTYRAEPSPWDTDIVDKSADIEPDVPSAVYVSPEVPPDYHGSRSWRL